MERRRLVPVLVAGGVLAVLVYLTVRHRDSAPVDLATGDGGKAPGQAVDIYSTSGKNRRLTEGGGDEPLPAGHPAIPDASPHGAGATPPANSGDDGNLPVTFQVPAGWTAQPPASAMRLAQWSLPGEGAEAGGSIYLASAGGDVTSNVTRWAKQMEKDEAAVSTLTVAGMAVTRVDVSGTFAGMAVPGAPPAARKENWRLLGAVFETGDTLLFVKATGPAATMAREEKAFDAFIASFKPKAKR